MRIPFTKVWRAFPELDRFDDDRCKRFVKRASQAFWLVKLFRFLMHLLGIAIGGVVVGFVLQAAFVLADDWRLRSPSRDIFVAAAASVTGLLAFVALLSVRNRFLRKRIRTIINTRGTCLSCGYSLLGLPVPDSLKLPCPECGFTCEVDPSLGELSSDPAGRATFTPRSDLIAQRVFWTPKRRRVATWSAVALTVLTGAGVGLSLWIKQLRINADVAQAQADLLTLPTMLEIYQRSLPADRRSGNVRMVDQLAAMKNLIAKAQAEALQPVSSQADEPGTKITGFRYDWINPAVIKMYVQSLDEPQREGEQRSMAAQAENARRALDVLDRTPFRSLAESVASGSNWAVDYPSTVTSWSAHSWKHDSHARELAKVSEAQQYRAWQRGDLQEFQLWSRFSVEVVRFTGQQIGLLSALMSRAAAASLMSMHMQIISEAPDPRWLDCVEEFWRSMDLVPISIAVDSEFAYFRNELTFFFSDRALLDKGIVGTSKRIGSYSENLEVMNAWHEASMKYVQSPPWKRSWTFNDERVENLAFLSRNMPSIESRAASDDQHDQSRQTILTMTALERHRLAHGQYPAQLADLPKDALANLPVDLATGLPAAYRRIDPKLDPKHRGYLLYLLGPDREDNAGNDYMPDTELFAIPKNSIPKGSDIVLNGRPW